MNKYTTKYSDRELSILPCVDGQELLEFGVDYYSDKDCCASFAIKTDYLGDTHGPRHIFSRFKRAWKAFCNKPVYHAEIIVSNADDAYKWLDDCKASLDRIKEKGYKLI